ncbi:hypothetical protein PFLmoz3_02477 [Pseudomonas fluorescens]|uniref:Uncharacterized protein n=1 Tax=Pseudomonas fluorescens TaxID=294 RepID=A0A109LHQ3_PSEFL|nr:hypothetical protein PFLmoz3_02477 [Pseudomonas fluorescens]
MFIRINGRFKFTGLGQGIAAVVVGIGVAALGKPLDGLGVIAGFVQRHALPLRVLEVFCGFGRAFVLEQVLALLVGAQPQVLQPKSIAGLRRAHQQQG